MNVALACTLACVLFAVPDAELLKSKGLKLSAGVYVVAEEGELQKGLADLRPLQKALATAQKEANALKRELEDNEKIIPQLVAQNRTLRAQLNQAENNTAVYNRIIGQINNNNEAISERQRAASDPDYGKETRAKLAAAREGYMNKLLAMRVAIDKGRKKYEEFAKEEAIGKAIAAVGSEAEKEYALGPSKNFERNVKALEKLEGSVMSEDIELQRQRGTWGVEVVLNGKFTKQFIFDTGASSISLPGALAAECGLVPNSDTPTVKVRIANGDVVEGKLMKLDSVRVGKFTVENVECIVMPASLTDVPALLGGAFLNNFNYKMDPDRGKLHLSKVDDLSGDDKKGAKKEPVKKKPAKK